MNKFIKYISKNKKRKILMIILVFMLFTFGTYSTVAYFFRITDKHLENKFNTANTTAPTVIEDFKDGDFIKKNVKIKVNTTYSSYIRAKVIVNWKDDSNNVLAIPPVRGEDYSISYTLGKWNDNEDGYYYYYEPIIGESDVLISECKVLKKSPVEGYKLNVEVIAQAVQSVPIKAVEDLWGVTVLDDGTITK